MQAFWLAKALTGQGQHRRWEENLNIGSTIILRVIAKSDAKWRVTNESNASEKRQLLRTERTWECCWLHWVASSLVQYRVTDNSQRTLRRRPVLRKFQRHETSAGLPCLLLLTSIRSKHLSKRVLSVNQSVALSSARSPTRASVFLRSVCRCFRNTPAARWASGKIDPQSGRHVSSFWEGDLKNSWSAHDAKRCPRKKKQNSSEDVLWYTPWWC